MKIRIFVCVLVSIACSVYAQDSECRVSDGSVGICKRFTDCKLLQQTAQIFRDKNASNKKKNAARNEILERTRVCYDHIGNKRCCSDCTTPDGKGGIRKDIRECDHLYKLIKGYKKADVQYVKTLLINNTLDVCCVPPPPEPKNDCDAQIDLPPSPESKCCGVDSSLSNKIVGGIITSIEEYPWTVLLDYKIVKNKPKPVCAGTLISNRHVITAAHCTRNQIINNVIVGEYNMSNAGKDCFMWADKTKDCNYGAQAIPVKTVVQHPNYTQSHKSNDIAIITLKYPVEFSAFVRPICLPKSKPQKSDKFVVTGWGKDDSRKQSKLKQAVQLQFVEREICRKSYHAIWDEKICAGGEPGKDSCLGDSGGPLMVHVNSSMPHFELAGVVSYGSRSCGVKGKPGVYANVYHYIDWIWEKIQ